MSTIGPELEADAIDAAVAAARAYEPAILTLAEHALDTGEGDIDVALGRGMKAKVPLAGGAIASAIDQAIAEVEADQKGDLKTFFDAVLAWLQARSTQLRSSA